MGVHVLTLASTVVKPTADGQLPEDSATCAWDADPQEAGVLETMRRVSRLVAKTRRDEWLTHRERRKDDVEDGECPKTGALNPEVDGYVGWPTHQPHQSSSPHPRERARKSTLPHLDTFVATRDLTGLCLAA